MQIIFNKIILKNWGPYYDEMKIDFSSDPIKNVTYVVGRNSAGKTCIFDGIYWCLFNYQDSDSLTTIVNKKALSNKETEMYVTIKFYVIDDYGNRTDYEVKRILHYSIIKTDDDILPDEFQSNFSANRFTQASEKPELISETDFKKLIDNYIPVGPRPFFFLDGEKLAELFTKERAKMIESYANALSDMDLIKTVISNLEETWGMYEQSLSKGEVLPDKAKKIKEKLDQLKKKRDEEKTREKELLDKLSGAHAYEAELGKQCKQYEELKPLIEKVEKLESQKTILKNQYKVQYSEFCKVLNDYFVTLMLQKQMVWCYRDLTKKKQDGIIPTSKVPLALIKEIKDIKKECICGRELNDDVIARFNELLNKLPIQEEINESIDKFWYKLEDEKKYIKDNKEEIETELSKIRKLNIEINKLTNEINNESKYIPDDIKDYKEMVTKFKKWGELKETISDLQNQLSTVQTSLVMRESDLNKEKRAYDRNIKKDSKMKQTGRKLEFTRIAKETMMDVQDMIKFSMIDFVKDNTSNGFLELIWDPSNWKSIEIDVDWQFSALTTEGYKLPCNRLSAGQRHVLGISFMSSLGKATGNLIPFVFDSPFGRISEDPIERIGKNLPMLMENRQVILLVTDTEDSNIRPHITNIIGKEYCIDKLTATESKVKVI